MPDALANLVALFEGLFPDDDVVKVNYFTAQVTGKFDPHKPLRQQPYFGGAKHAQLPSEITLTNGKVARKPVGF